ncbi:MAG: coproporphyrinogen dehydrogenase HemZ, partial [Oscillospiraceae bacterium]
MIAYSVLRLTEEDYEPYYLYRQSRMAGNLENTGWAKKGTVCAYNIYTMDESLTVMACGAGGVTKIKDPYSDQLERIFNFKYAYEYISRFPEI